MGYALSARGIFAPAQKCRMYQSRSTFPQGAALGYGQQLGLQPAPIIYWAFVQIGSYKIHLFLTFSAALGIARTSSALHSLARKFVKFVGKKTGKFVLKSAISRQAKANKFSLVFWLNEIVGFRRLFWKNVANYALFSCFI